ncbi:MAG: DUF4249 domain-containing protein, partial [Bacteroidota bacterium]
MRYSFFLYIAILFVGCEDVVTIPLPDEQNLVVVEGWITDREEIQQIRLTRSNSFLGTFNPIIEDAAVIVEERNGAFFSYLYQGNGYYLSASTFSGVRNQEYRVEIRLSNGDIIQSEWSRMPPRTDIISLEIDDFIENDPDSPGQELIVFFPRVTALDSADFSNYYRWMFSKNSAQLTAPESITLQNDRFFDGNLIPNQFDSFEYELTDTVAVALLSINKSAFEFLDLLKSQIT